jgi:hypothetical protein
MEHRCTETDRGKPKYSGKNLSQLSTTNPTRTDPGSNPGLRGEKPATNRLSHSTAKWKSLLSARFQSSAAVRPSLLLDVTRRNIDSSLLTFHDILVASPSTVKQSNAWPLKVGPIDCPRKVKASVIFLRKWH